MIECKHLVEGNCIVASNISQVWCKPTEQQCIVCSNDPHTPQGINPITCALAHAEQDKQGLEPDPRLLDCVNNENSRYYEDQDRAEQGRKAWEILHKKEFHVGIKLWILEEWMKIIPQNCGCGKTILDYIDENPLNFHNQEEYQRWTHKLHNFINRKLFYAEITYEQACEIWGWK